MKNFSHISASGNNGQSESFPQRPAPRSGRESDHTHEVVKNEDLTPPDLLYQIADAMSPFQLDNLGAPIYYLDRLDRRRACL